MALSPIFSNSYKMGVLQLVLQLLLLLFTTCTSQGTRPGCLEGVNYATAVSHCSGQSPTSLALCTLHDINVTAASRGTGCSFDGYHVWTSTPCNANAHWIAITGSGDGVYPKTARAPECAPDSSTQSNVIFWQISDIGVACCPITPDTTTAAPTQMPSANPSQSPSEMPSANPSKSPSEMPSESPSKSPSEMPSESPTKSPSEMPSESPSANPSKSPVVTDSPSESPSEMPSEMPSESPSEMPSESPSEMPSESPSEMPSANPSKSPSEMPSANPIQSISPTEMPSNGPIKAPTNVPTTVLATDASGSSHDPGEPGSAAYIGLVLNGVLGLVMCLYN